MEKENSLAALLDQTNIAESLTPEELNTIGAEAYDGFMSDYTSRGEWEEHLDKWTKLAKQTVEPKTYPWPKASNVKYPLLSTAAMQFAARAYPSLIPSDGRVVKAKPVGKDPTGEKREISEAVSIYMSYQFMEEMDDWEEDMDKMLIMLPIVGTMFKKTYWNKTEEKICSHIIMPKNLVVDYWAKNLEKAERISEVIEMSPRLVKEKQQAGLWLDISLGDAPIPENSKNAPRQDNTTPYIIIEQHTYLDLDEDGYPEPYIITFHKDSRKVLRIMARFDDKSIVLTEDNKLAKIKPIQYYTKFSFVPNPDGGFYDIGFGVLLGPLNEAVNTLINQLTDSGTISNLQSGFLGKGLRLRMGESAFKPGEWKAVNATGDDLRKQIVPLPSKEPSNVLFQLMGSLISSGKELASVAEIFVGKMPGQNTPATTTMATIEQGMKVFTAVYKRLYRSLASEFYKAYRLNAIYINPNTVIDVIDMPIGPEAFNLSQHDICPGADPTAVSQTEKLLKAQGLMELLPLGMLNPVEVIKRVLEAQEQPNWEALLNPEVMQSGQPPAPPPDPKLQEMQMKGQIEQQKMAQKAQQDERKGQLEARDKTVQLAMKSQEHAMDLEHKAQMNKLAAAEAIHKQRIFSAEGTAKAVQGLAHKEATHAQKMSQMKEQKAVQKKGAK